VDEQSQPPAVRASDADREAVATVLGRNQAEGRLTLDEFSQRLDLVYAAKRKDELEAVTRDLPAVPDPATRNATGWVISVLGGSRRVGRWRASGRVRVIAVLGGADIDLSHAVVTTPELRMRCFSFLGGISITVPKGVEVELTGFSLIGGRDLDVGDEPSRPGTPLIRVRAFSLLGGITVQNPPQKRL
jgi:Domain of unknown function (DUF1707)/Cell wall-active antibiotics response 4TMS YvqF